MCFYFELGWVVVVCDFVIDVELVLFMVGFQCCYVFFMCIFQFGVVFEGIVDFDEVVVDCVIIFEQYLDYVEICVDVFKYVMMQVRFGCWYYYWWVFYEGWQCG